MHINIGRNKCSFVPVIKKQKGKFSEVGDKWQVFPGVKATLNWSTIICQKVSYGLFTSVVWFMQYQFSAIQSLICVWLFVTPWTQHARPPCPSPTPRVYPNSCPLSWWCHLTISYSISVTVHYDMHAYDNQDHHFHVSKAGRNEQILESKLKWPNISFDHTLIGWNYTCNLY